MYNYEGDTILQGGYNMLKNRTCIVCVVRVTKMDTLETISSCTTDGEGRLQTSSRHAPDIDKNELVEGHRSAATRRREWLAGLFELVLHQSSENPCGVGEHVVDGSPSRALLPSRSR